MQLGYRSRRARIDVFVRSTADRKRKDAVIGEGNTEGCEILVLADLPSDRDAFP
jgi:hypothetical protein